jgi:NhaA family Na+:H+ antiporter
MDPFALRAPFVAASFRVSSITDPIALAVALGLLVGKPIGILGASWIAVRSGPAKLPDDIHWGTLFGGGVLAGIGFTMALFIAGLALADETLGTAKVGILLGSGVAAVLGLAILRARLPAPDA